MRKTSRTLLVALAGAILIVTGCSDDPMGLNSGDEVTFAEADDVFTEIFSAFAQVFLVFDIGGPPLLTLGPVSVGPALAVVTETFDETSSCGVGGTIRVTGSVSGDIDDGAETGTVSFDVTETLTNCMISTQGDGTVFTVNTSPPVRMTGDFSFSPTLLTADISFSGGFAFTTSDGRTGTCAIDISLKASVTTTEDNEVVSGTVCGQSFASM